MQVFGNKNYQRLNYAIQRYHKGTHYTRGVVERLIQQDAKPTVQYCICLKTMPECYCFTYCTSVAVLIVFLVVFAKEFIWEIQTTLIFIHQTIGKCQYSTGLGVQKYKALFRLLLGYEIVDARDLKCHTGRLQRCISQQCFIFQMQCIIETKAHFFV